MKRPTGSRYLIIKQLIKVMQKTIERLDSSEAADQLENEIHRARKGAILDDKTANEMLQRINQIRDENGWF